MEIGFVGTYTPRMDDKGRVTIPAKYRERFTGGVMLVRGQDNTLFIFTMPGFAEFAHRAIHAEITDEAQLGFQRYMLANAEDQHLDSQGRITIPAKMRDYAGLGKEIVINGAGLRLEIWPMDRWTAYESEQETAYSKPAKGVFGSD